jgi:DNA-binding CsgD family transcriptional regulator
VIHLSPREQDVLDLMAEGYQDPAIAAALFIAHGTVKTRKAAIYQKLGAHNGAQAVHLAYQAGLLSACDPGDLVVVRQAREMGYRIALAPLAGGAR